MIMGNHVLLGGSGLPHLTMVQCKGSAGALLSRSLPGMQTTLQAPSALSQVSLPLDQGSSVAVVSSTRGQFPSLAPSALHATDTDMPPDCCNRSCPTDAKVKRSVRTPHSYSFTAVLRDGYAEQGVSFNQVARLIKSIRHVGRLTTSPSGRWSNIRSF
jgi:hypothetical protein